MTIVAALLLALPASASRPVVLAPAQGATLTQGFALDGGAADFDGGRRLAPLGLEPLPELSPLPAAPEVPPASETPGRAVKWALRGSVAGGALAPIAIGAEPWMYAVYALTAAAVAYGVFLAGMLITRRRVKRAVTGAALGFALGLAPHMVVQPVVETAFGAFKPKDQVERAMPELQHELRASLETTAQGRRILEGLKDHAGRVRMPDLYFGSQKIAYADYSALYDGVRIERDLLLWAEVTPEQLEDPEVRARFLASVEPILAHEVKHAEQNRRAPWDIPAGPAVEQEAHLAEFLYVHERLRADPHAKLFPVSVAGYREFLEDPAYALRSAGGADAPPELMAEAQAERDAIVDEGRRLLSIRKAGKR